MRQRWVALVVSALTAFATFLPMRSGLPPSGFPVPFSVTRVEAIGETSVPRQRALMTAEAYRSYTWYHPTTGLRTGMRYGYLNTSGYWSSTIRLLNTSNSPNGYTVEFYLPNNGSPVRSTARLVLGPQQAATLNAGDYYSASDMAAIVRSDYPVAVSAELFQSGNPGEGYESDTYSAQTVGADAINLPSIMNSYWNWTTDFNIQNIGRLAANVRLTYYPWGATQDFSIPANGFVHVGAPPIPGGSLGSAELRVLDRAQDMDAGRELIVTVRQRLQGGYYNSSQMYNGVNSKLAQPQAMHPSIYRNYYSWTASLNVQNMGNQSTNITAFYYGPNGNPIPVVHYGVAPKSQTLFYSPPELGENFYGAVVVTDDNYQPLGLVVNENFAGGPTNQSSEGESLGARKLWVANLKSMASTASSVVVQNLGTVTATIRIDLFSWNDVPCGASSTLVGAWKGVLFYVPNLVGSDPNCNPFDGYGIVSSSGPAVRMASVGALVTNNSDGDWSRMYKVSPLTVDDMEPRPGY